MINFIKLLNQIFAIIFYTLFFLWIFFKIRNFILIKKTNNTDFLKKIQNNSKNANFSKKAFKLLKILLISFLIYLGTGFILWVGLIILWIFTVGGTALENLGLYSLYSIFLKFVLSYFNLLKYILYYLYLMIFICLIRSIYINKLIYTELSTMPREFHIEKNNTNNNN